MAGQYHKKLIEPDEVVIFDRRHSLWEIWKNFLIGAGAIVVLILLLTEFKPGPSDETNWGYVILISALAIFFVVVYGGWPLFERRNQQQKRMFVPITAIVLAAAGWGVLMWFRNSDGFADIWTKVVWVAFVVVIVGWLVYPVFAWIFSHFMLTDRRLILSQGIINKSTMAMPLEQLNDVKTTQNAWERIFDYGDVVIETAGEFGQQNFTNIGHPLEVKKIIFEQRKAHEEQQETRRGREMARDMAEAIQAAPPSAAPPAEGGMVERLEKLSELHRAGSLSDTEFQKAKEELLEMGDGGSSGGGTTPSGGE